MAVITIKGSRRAKSAKKTAAAADPKKTVPKSGGVEFPGKPLLDNLWVKLKERGETTHQLAKQLGIAYPYLMALARDERKLPNVDREVLENAANYLGIPVAQAYILAGALKHEDFFFADSLDAEIKSLYEAMSKHPHWCGYAPSRAAWEALPQQVKLLIGMLFERVTGKSLFRYAEIEGGGS